VGTPGYGTGVATPPVDPDELETRPPAAPARALGSGYLLDVEIGGGATGRVWRGRRRLDGAPVAVKLLRAEFARDTDAVFRFLRQRTVLSAVNHPHLVAVHDLVAEGDVVAIVMELVEGEDLRTLTRHRRLSRMEALSILGQVAGALGAVHRAGVVHRDVKPENVLVSWRGSAPHAMLTDFGLARVLDSPVWTSVSQLAGTPAYVAPELVAGRTARPASDVYALGVTAYELLAGERPFRGATTAALLREHLDATPVRPPDVPDAIWALLAASLAKDPAHRPDAAEFARRLEAATVARPGGLGQSPAAAALRASPAEAALRASPIPPGGPGVRPEPRQAVPVSDAPTELLAPVSGETASGVVERLATTTAKRPAPPEAVPAAPRRGRRWPLWLAAGLCVLLAGGLGLWLGQPKRTGQQPTNSQEAPPPQPYFLPVSATSVKAGTVRLVFSDASAMTGFELYVIYRDGIVIDNAYPGSGVPPYVVTTDDHRTRHCYTVAALLSVAQTPPALSSPPACKAADGKPEE